MLKQRLTNYLSISWPGVSLPVLAGVALVVFLSACSEPDDGAVRESQVTSAAAKTADGHVESDIVPSMSPGDRARAEDGVIVEGQSLQGKEVVPEVTALYLEPHELHAGADLTVEPELLLPDGAVSVFVKYTWVINGEPYLFAQGENLPSDTFSRGDSIYVEVLPVVDGVEGKLFRSAPFQILNAKPVIVSDPSEGVTQGSIYTYQVRAEDADGDDLVYFVEEGPPGFQIDRTSGAVSWDFSLEPAGSRRIKIGVKDSYEGTSFQEVQLDLGVQTKERNG